MAFSDGSKGRWRLGPGRWRSAAAVVLAVLAGAAVLPALTTSQLSHESLRNLLDPGPGTVLTWRGEPQIDFFPTPSVSLQHVQMRRMRGDSAVLLAAVPEVRISVAILPLLWGQVRAEWVTLRGSFEVGGRTVQLDAELTDPRQAFSPAGTRGRIRLAGLTAAPLEAAGVFRLSQNPGPAAVPAVRITDGDFSVGDSTARGELAVSLAGGRPQVSGRLDFHELVLSPYLDAWLPDSLAELLARPVSGRWLTLADVDLALTAERVDLGTGQVAEAAARLRVRDGHLAFAVTEAGIAGGHLRAGVRAAPAGSGLALRAVGRLDDVSVAEAGHLLDPRPSMRLIGTEEPPHGSGTGSFRLSARGTTVADLVASLSGWAVAEVRNGSVEGADAVSTLERVVDDRAGIAEGHAPFIPIAGRTHFSRLSASLVAGNGVARLERMRLRGEQFDITLTGELDLTGGELVAQGTARLFDPEAGGMLVELPFGVGGTLQDPMGAPGIPRHRSDRGDTARQPSVEAPARAAVLRRDPRVG